MQSDSWWEKEEKTFEAVPNFEKESPFSLKYLLISRSVYTPALLRSQSQEGKFLCGVLEAVEQIL